jgi:hypothetical protein
MALIRTPANQSIVVKPHVQALANALQQEFGIDSFGTYLGHSHPEGPTQAIDIFTPDNTAGYALQDRICAFLRAHAKRFGHRYHIRRRQIWNIERSGEGYRNQTVTGNRTADHMDHIHDTQYAFAPGPFGPITPTPQQPTTILGEDMLIINVDQTGIFLLRGDQAQHLQSPDHVFAFVRAGVPYQDKVSMPLNVAQSYLGIGQIHGVIGRVADLETGEKSDYPEFTYDEMLEQVQAGLEEIKEEYYRIMQVG